MQLILDDEQRMLAKTALAFALDGGGVRRLRELRDSGEPLCYSRKAYSQMAELGFTAITTPEADGGLGLGLASMVVVTEALGRALAPEPVIPSAVLCASLLSELGSAEQKKSWLAPLASGEKVLACAYSETGSRFDLSAVQMRAEPTANGYRLSGDKTHVWGGQGADAWIVSAQLGDEAGRLSLFLVPASTRGVTCTAMSRVDCHNAAQLTLRGVEIPATARLGQEHAGLPALERAIDRATVALCGEMLGVMSEAFDRTLIYLKERKQFGAAIGSFQALKHRAAKLYIEIELARSTVMAAARALDEDAPDAPALVSLAKARLSDGYCLAANEAVQIHAGIGMTDEHDIGFFMKRSRGAEMTFGDAAFHRDRFGRLEGY
jgi:alkylation response protein AidB-like acyl-CoA dehydrogenase